MNKLKRITITILVFVLTLTSFGIQPVKADSYTSKKYYVSDPNSGMYGKTLRLYYDSNGNVIEDTSGIIGNRSNYEITVNKTKDIVTIYTKEGNVYIPVKRFVCSDGGANTPEGVFYSPAKYRWWTLMGPCYGQWCTRIKGSVLFHSVYYSQQNNTTLSTSAYNKLGTTCSHGCVRLRAGDAKWIYDNCPSGVKITIYSKSGYEPFSKPVADKLPSWHTWDPTDPTAAYLCQQHKCHSAGRNGLVYDSIDNKWKYYQNGTVATYFTALVKYGNDWYYVQNGVINFGAYGLVQKGSDWWCVRGGKVDFGAYGLVQKGSDWWYVRGGKVDFGTYGLVQKGSDWWNVRGGKVDFGSTGLVQKGSDWWYVRKGKVDFAANTAVKHNNNWWAVRGGKVDFSYNGIVSNQNGQWLANSGRIDFTKSGIYTDGKNYFNIVNSRVTTEKSGLTQLNVNYMDFKGNVLGTLSGEYYLNAGKIDFSTNVVLNQGKWIYIKDGKADYSANTVAQNKYGWWVIKDGIVDFSFNGIASNEYGQWVIKDGKVDFNYNGTIDVDGVIYNVTNGRAVVA